jgi:ribosomal protein L32
MSAERAVARTCPKCGERILSRNRVFCPNCGVNMHEYATSHAVTTPRPAPRTPIYTDEQGTRLKKCPYCAEEIRAEAIVCKHCGRDLEPGRVQQIAAGRDSAGTATEKKEGLSGTDVFLAFALPIVGLIVAVVYLTRARSRERGLLLVVVSLIAWAVWWVICSWSGALSGF